MIRTIAIAILVIFPSVVSAADEPEKPPQNLAGHKLVAFEDFENGKSDKFEPTDKTAWKIEKQVENTVYRLIKKKSDYDPPVRSPYNRAILKDVELTDTILDVKLKSTSKPYNHRSLCLFFGYQDESHFYYVHFGKKTDDHANQIFIVNGKPRTKISTQTTAGTDWDDEWHHARVIRNAKTGTIEIYFDDMKKPVMKAQDKTFQGGRVGIGSFDDPGDFDNLAVYGTIKTE